MTGPNDVIARLDGKDIKAVDANILIHKVTEALFAHRLVTVDGRMYRRIQNEFQYRDTDAQQCVPWNNVELVSIFDLLLDGGFHDVVLEADYPLGGRQAFGLLFECRANVIECRNLKYGVPAPVRVTRTSEFKVRDPYGDQEWSPTFEFCGDWRVVE